MRLSLPRLVVAVLALASPAIAERLELPSQGLENRIEFWKKVYTQYGMDDVIIHDRIHVNLIYDVAAKGEQGAKILAVQLSLDEIRSNLSTPENLTPYAKQIFEKQGIPSEIALLPFVESSFENRALSSAGAAGIWQFTRGTGRLYMNVNKKVDERLDPAKATRAAARLLMENYNALGNWPLAITAYNHGRAGMVRAQNEVGSEITKVISDYKSPSFGYASMNFYSEFLAAVEVYSNYEQYFGQLTLETPSTRH